MKYHFHQLGILLFAVLLLPSFVSSQSHPVEALPYKVSKVYPYTSLSLVDLRQAETLADLNARYKSSWVHTYVSVEISASHQGQIKSALSKSDRLTQAQKSLMEMADKGKDIRVKILYLPENSLKQKELKELAFTLAIDPDIDAKFIGGQAMLDQYLQQEAIEKIPDNTFVNYDLAAIKFTVNEEGEITNAQISQAFKDEKVDALLLAAIRKMPCWEPAQYADGTKVKQDFVLTVGSMDNCYVNLLNIDRY